MASLRKNGVLMFLALCLALLIEGVNGGPWLAAALGGTSYFACMGACVAGAGLMAGAMSGGVMGPSGMVTGSSACSVICKNQAAGIAMAVTWTPTP